MSRVMYTKAIKRTPCPQHRLSIPPFCLLPLAKRRVGVLYSPSYAGSGLGPCAQRRCYPTGRCTY